MIVTITLNPAIDRTIRLSELNINEVNRISHAEVEIGGKGINVSKAVRALGSQSIALGFSAGANARFFKDRLTSLGIHYDLVDVPGQIRTNIKIVDAIGNHTDINEEGFEVSDSDCLRLFERLEAYGGNHTLYVLSGSIPPNMSMQMFKKLCRTLSRNGKDFIADMHGEYLKVALEYKPLFVKPNMSELSDVLGEKISTVEQAKKGAEILLEMGAKNVCVSMGASGTIFVNNDYCFYTKPCAVDTVGPVGAGDAVVGAIAHGVSQNMCFEELARFSTAMGSASTKLEGTAMATLKSTFKIYQNCMIEEI